MCRLYERVLSFLFHEHRALLLHSFFSFHSFAGRVFVHSYSRLTNEECKRRRKNARRCARRNSTLIQIRTEPISSSFFFSFLFFIALRVSCSFSCKFLCTRSSCTVSFRRIGAAVDGCGFENPIKKKMNNLKNEKKR